LESPITARTQIEVGNVQPRGAIKQKGGCLAAFSISFCPRPIHEFFTMRMEAWRFEHSYPIRGQLTPQPFHSASLAITSSSVTFNAFASAAIPTKDFFLAALVQRTS